MPPVPIYSDRPINPAKAEDANPQTAPPPANTSTQPSKNPASNSTTSTAENHPAAPSPGAGAVPAPTGAITSRVPQVNASLARVEPTRTTTAANDAPPPPQPGAMPIARTAAPLTASQASSIPPPPRAGDGPTATSAFSSPAAITPSPSTTSATVQDLPSQLSVPPPSQNAAPTHSTVPATTISYGGQYRPANGQTSRVPPAVLAAQSQGETGISPEHPPGYVQNPYADMMSRTQLETNNGLGRTSGGMGLGGNSDSHAESSENEPSLWDTAKKWVGEAGKGLQQLEEEAWKRVNGK